MRRTARVAIATPSAIAAEGMAAILRHQPELVVAIHVVDSAHQMAMVAEGKYSAYIIDPATPGITPELLSDNTVIALAMGLLPPDSLKGYSAAISLYERADDIAATVRRLVLATDNSAETRSLTQREKEIIVAVVSGKSNKEIAADMSVSVHTIMTHRRNIAAKLHIHSPAALTIFAIASKLVDINEVVKA